jgi:Uma2 family endonuclease
MSVRDRLPVTVPPPPVPRSGPYTFDDFCAIVRDGQKADLINGVIYMASPDSFQTSRLCGWLYSLMRDYVEERELGEVHGPRNAFRVNDRNSPEPDIAFIAKARLARTEEGSYFPGGPDLAVEVVSPESVDRDYRDKVRLYESAGVREYWIIDEDAARITLLRLDDKRRYREVKAVDGDFRSRVLPGFRLRADWLFKHPRPKKSVVLKMLLA